MTKKTLKEKRDTLIDSWVVKLKQILTQDIGARRRAATTVALSLVPRLVDIYDNAHLNIADELLYSIANSLTIDESWVSNLSEASNLIRELREFIDASPIVTDLALIKRFPKEMERPHILRVHLDDSPPQTF